MTVEEIIYKEFKDERTIWFDFVDYIKINYDISRKGLSYSKKHGRYEIYAESEDGESILLDVLENNQGYKLDLILGAFKI